MLKASHCCGTILDSLARSFGPPKAALGGYLNSESWILGFDGGVAY